MSYQHQLVYHVTLHTVRAAYFSAVRTEHIPTDSPFFTLNENGVQSLTQGAAVTYQNGCS